MNRLLKRKIKRWSEIDLLWTFLLLCLISFYSAGCIGSPSGSDSDVISPFPVTEGWEYRWGDSPFDAQKVPVWTYEESEDSDWRSIEYRDGVSNPGDRQGRTMLWLRVKLPDEPLRDPRFWIQFVGFACEVYLDKEVVYRFKAVDIPGQGRLSEFHTHRFPLDTNFQNKLLCFRIYSEDPTYIGLGIIRLGSHAGFTRDLIKEIFSMSIFGLLFLIAGILALVLFLFRLNEKMYFVFGILCVCIGLWVLSSTEVWEQYFALSKILSYISLPMQFLTAAAVCAYFERIYGSGYRSVIRRLWQFFLIYAVFAIILLLSKPSWAFLFIALYVFFAVFGAAILFLFATSVRKAIKGNRDAILITCGFAVFSFFGLYDILGGIFKVFPWTRNTYQWGMFVFMISLGLVLERRFRSNAVELQQSHKQLKEYSQTLEKKVKERTKDLEDKNIELAKLLKELDETQDQLIMQEKMASLGNLVAGVAHEVNTPVGAVKSAADVISRSLNRIKAILDSGQSLEDVRTTGELLRSLEALQENNQITALASDRIARIVKSLKAFARLDEAEFKKTNIHDGLDSTLTLINYQIKDRITVVKEYGEIPEINGYPNQLNQVFMNILMNASQAIEKDGIITIKTKRDEDKIAITISDNGAGIPPEHLDKIFDPGFTSRGVGVGTGLGLSISYKIIKKHNGEIKVESEVGRGSSFTIFLPADL